MGCCNTNKVSDEVVKNESDFLCPMCGKDGAVVKKITLQSLLLDDVKPRIHDDLDYKYCKNPKCPIVYFCRLDDKNFYSNELREKATAKDMGMDVKVCYCFNLSRQNILSELEMTGTSTALVDVKNKMKDPGCFCERSNPQGGCCLGNIKAWINEAKAISRKT
jgi:hypothetical protein